MASGPQCRREEAASSNGLCGGCPKPARTIRELESHELRAQAEVLESIRQATAPDPGLIDSLRRRARERASIYESVVSPLISSHARLKKRTDIVSVEGKGGR
jgi:hypothetical protein